uniref:Uncharacterized protein n=1 Tax=Panagrolaimus davidi TaxID=227884 RepID=A0A914PYE0_9BILA
MEWLLPSLNNTKLLQSLNSSTFGSSSSSSILGSDVPPPPSLSMEPEETHSNTINNIITLDDESDEDDDGPPMLDLAVPAAAAPTPAITQKRPSSILNVPVSKEQFSIIEAHKDGQPKTLLEALQKFNESRKTTTPLSSLAGSSKSFVNPNQSNAAAAAALTRLLPSLLKKPVTPLAALPKKSAPPTMPVFSYKKPIVLRPKTSSPTTSTIPSSTISTTPILPKLIPTPNSEKTNPSFSISIKETMNPLLESLIAAASKKQSPKVVESCDNSDKPPILTDFSSASSAPSSDDVNMEDEEKFEMLKLYLNIF